MNTPSRRNRKVQTTIRLPKPLYEQAKSYVEEGFTAAATINDFIIAAIQAYTKMLRRKKIDAAFGPMVKDANYQKEVQAIAEEFAESDWESLHAGPEVELEAHVAR